MNRVVVFAHLRRFWSFHLLFDASNRDGKHLFSDTLPSSVRRQYRGISGFSRDIVLTLSPHATKKGRSLVRALALNAVVHWNAIYMQEAIHQVRSDGMDVSDDDIAHISPLIWRHLNFLGRYDFSLPETVMNGGHRPLSNPTSAWDF